MNCYRLDRDRALLRDDVRNHRSGGDVYYAFIDFDQSIMLPEGVSLRERSRPADETGYGAMLYKPCDVALCEPMYNPFAFDVGMLGNIFRTHFSVRVITSYCVTNAE